MTSRFRRRTGPPPNDSLDDAWLLASILVPEKSASDRVGLGAALGIPVPPIAPVGVAARAREVEVVGKVLRDRMARMDASILDQLHRILAGGATRLGHAVEAALADLARQGLGGEDSPGDRPRANADPAATSPFIHVPALQEAKERVPVAEREVVEALGPGGPIDGALQGFELRPGQVRMARAVTRALNDGLRLLVEAGTGTGKSLAYLVPAAMHAVQNGRRVVISTHTIALQDQLVGKDIPVLRRALPHDVQVAVLKGRSHYLCVRRWRRFLSSGLTGEAERILAARIAVWVRGTATGDRGEIALDDADISTWNAHLAADVVHCTPRSCPDNRAGRCFLTRARRRAAGAHLLVVNHALLLSDLATAAGGERGILPDYAEAIIDEAHHLEAVATDHLGAEVATGDLANALAAMSVPLGGGRFGGSVARVAATYVDVGGQFARETVGEVTGPIHEAVAATRDLIAPLREALVGVLEARARPGADSLGERELRLVPDVREGPDWLVACEAWESLSGAMAEASTCLRRFADAFDPHVGTSENVDDAVAELVEATTVLSDTRAVLARIIESPVEGEVSWVSLDRRSEVAGRGTREVRLHAAPLEVDRHLQALLFEPLEAVVLTSATLQVDGSFRHARQRLGLGATAQVLSVESPFDFETQSLLVVPRNLPDPASTASSPVLHEILAGIASVMGGRTLMLFTSHASLRGAHAALKDALPQLVVLGQGVDGSRTILLERFRATPNSILLGTASFWEGIDVTGDALSCLVILKLPFTVPNDPVFAARSELLANPFAELAIPQAVLRLRQGFGRLIRSTADRGVAVVLDSRLVSRNYGQTFLGSLPPATRQVCDARDVVKVVDDWWRGRHSPLP